MNAKLEGSSQQVAFTKVTVLNPPFNPFLVCVGQIMQGEIAPPVDDDG